MQWERQHVCTVVWAETHPSASIPDLLLLQKLPGFLRGRAAICLGDGGNEATRNFLFCPDLSSHGISSDC